MRATVLAAASAAPIVPSTALAHDAAGHTGGDFWIVATLCGLVLCHFLYERGVSRLRSAREGSAGAPPPSRRAAFVAGELAIGAALVSPLERLAADSLTLHMVQHMLLVIVAPILLISARPLRALTAALPALAGWIGRGRLSRIWPAFRVLARPLPAAAAHALVLWLWHVPAFFDAAVANVYWHMAEHAAFLATGSIFWSAVLRAQRDRSACPSAFLALLITVLLGGMMGAWIALAPDLLFASAGRGGRLGLEPLEDQQLAGLLMWVPAGLAYLGAAIGLTAVFLRRSGFAEHQARGSVGKLNPNSPRDFA